MTTFSSLIDREGRGRLGLRVPAQPKKARALFGPQPPGLILRDGRTEAWPIETFTTEDGSLWVGGPVLEGRPLLECISGPIPDDRFGLLFADLGRLLLALDRRYPGARFHPAGIHVLSDGGLAAMPPTTMDKISALEPIEERMAGLEPFTHPDLAGDEAMVFGLAVAAFKALTGVPPFAAETPEDLRDMIRELPAPAPASRAPDLRHEVSLFLQVCLSPGKNRRRPSLADWVAEVEGWTDLRDLLSESEKARRAQMGEAADLRSLGYYRRRRFWRRNWPRAAVAGLGALVVGYVAMTVAGNLLRPRVTRGLEPRAVVEAFYAAMNSLDHRTMEDAVVGDAGEAYINEVINLFVISRARMAVEGANPFVDARSWLAKGRPPLQAGKSVYGAGPLIIRGVAVASENRRAFEVEFERWTPRWDEAGTPSAGTETTPLGVRVVERCVLEHHRGDWLIHRIDRLSETPIE